MQYYNQEFNKYAGNGIRFLPKLVAWGKNIAKHIPFIGSKFRKGEQTIFDFAKKLDRIDKGKKALKVFGGAAVTGATVGDLWYNVKNQADKDAVKAAVGALDENQKLKQYVVQNAMNSVTPTGIPEIDAAKAKELAEAKELADQFEIGKLFDISSPYAQYYTLPTAAGATLGGLLYGGKGSAIGGVGGLGLGLLAKYISDSQNKSTADTPTLSA